MSTTSNACFMMDCRGDALSPKRGGNYQRGGEETTTTTMHNYVFPPPVHSVHIIPLEQSDSNEHVIIWFEIKVLLSRIGKDANKYAGNRSEGVLNVLLFLFLTMSQSLIDFFLFFKCFVCEIICNQPLFLIVSFLTEAIDDWPNQRLQRKEMAHPCF